MKKCSIVHFIWYLVQCILKLPIYMIRMILRYVSYILTYFITFIIIVFLYSNIIIVDIIGVLICFLLALWIYVLEYMIFIILKTCYEDWLVKCMEEIKQVK